MMKAWKMVHAHPEAVNKDRALLDRLGQDPALPHDVRMELGLAGRNMVHPLLSHTSRLWENPPALHYVLCDGLSQDITDANGLPPLWVAMGLAPPWRSSAGFVERHPLHLQSMRVLIDAGADLLHAMGLPNASGVRSQARHALGWAERFGLWGMADLLRAPTEQRVLEKSLMQGLPHGTRKRL